MTVDSNASGEAGVERLERPIDSILVNAVADVLGDGDPTAMADEASAELVRSVLSDATSERQLEEFGRAVEAGRVDGDASGEAREATEAVVNAVREEFGRRGVRAVVDHEVSLTLSPRDAVIYTFARTRDPDVLAELPFSADARDFVMEGARRVSEGEFATAAEQFERAVDVGGSDDAVAIRTLAAFAHHWAGHDRATIDLVEEALHLHADAWIPTLAGYCADPDESYARPEQFRTGKYASEAFVRCTVDVPDSCAVTVSLGYETDSGTEWLDLEGTPGYLPVDRLAPQITVRIRLEGGVPAFPAMHGYYLASGVVDQEVDEVRDVYRILLSGPENETAIETVRFESVTD